MCAMSLFIPLVACEWLFGLQSIWVWCLESSSLFLPALQVASTSVLKLLSCCRETWNTYLILGRCFRSMLLLDWRRNIYDTILTKCSFQKYSFTENWVLFRQIANEKYINTLHENIGVFNEVNPVASEDDPADFSCSVKYFRCSSSIKSALAQPTNSIFVISILSHCPEANF